MGNISSKKRSADEMERGSELEKVDTAAIPAITVFPTAEELEFSTVAPAPPEVTATEEEKDEELDPVTADVVMEINVAKDDAAVQENNKDEEEEYEEEDDGDDGNGDDEGHPHDKAAVIEEHASAVQHLRVSGLEDFLASIVGGGKSPESINTLLGRAVGCAQFCHEKVRTTFMPSKLFLTCSTISIDA